MRVNEELDKERYEQLTKLDHDEMTLFVMCDGGETLKRSSERAPSVCDGRCSCEIHYTAFPLDCHLVMKVPDSRTFMAAELVERCRDKIRYEWHYSRDTW